MTYLGHQAGAVIGEAVGQHGGPARTVALVARLLVRDAVELAHAAPDGMLHAVLGHVGFAGLVQRQAQARVGVRVAAAELRRYGDLLDQPREHLALLRIRSRLAVLDVRPFAVACHELRF